MCFAPWIPADQHSGGPTPWTTGQFGEVLAEELITRIGMRIEGDRQVDRLTALTRAGGTRPRDP